MADDSIADFETGDARADFYDLAGCVDAEDEWVFEPRKHEFAHVLDDPVDWVDGHGALSGSWN